MDSKLVSGKKEHPSVGWIEMALDNIKSGKISDADACLRVALSYIWTYDGSRDQEKNRVKLMTDFRKLFVKLNR